MLRKKAKPKLENLKNLALKNKLKSPVYVGDTEGDRLAAFGAGYEFVFVSYGFGVVRTVIGFSNFRSLVTALT